MSEIVSTFFVLRAAMDPLKSFGSSVGSAASLRTPSRCVLPPSSTRKRGCVSVRRYHFVLPAPKCFSKWPEIEKERERESDVCRVCSVDVLFVLPLTDGQDLLRVSAASRGAL